MASTSAAPPAEATHADVVMAQKTFELNNEIVTLDPADGVLRYDADEQRRILNERPWKADPHYFKKVRISAVALIKMVMHARSGGIYEIMGLMQGKVDDKTQTMYVMDAFALPVEGTETRVNAQNEAYEYAVQFQEAGKTVQRLENTVGWYHSHPGYGCWLSGIDVTTQFTNQQYQEPFVAIVIDPNRTISAGKVDIGAFRTYPQDYKPPRSAEDAEYQSIPLNKIEDFGVHANAYYALKVEVFKSSLDGKLLSLLWSKYWISTLSQSPLIVNRSYASGQVQDLAEKLSRSYHKTANQKSSTVSSGASIDLRLVGDDSRRQRQAGREEAAASEAAGDSKSSAADKGKGVWAAADKPDMHPKIQAAMQELAKRESSTPLAQAVKDSAKVASEAQHGLFSHVLKDMVFNRSAAGIGLAPL